MDLSKVNHDFSDKEVIAMEAYIAEGMPGLHEAVADDSRVLGMYELFLAGKPYSDISLFTRLRKEAIMYISIKNKWPDKKQRYFDEIQDKLLGKLVNVKLEAATFLASLLAALNRYYSKKVSKYIMTGDNKSLEDVMDPKTLIQYFKTIESIDKIITISQNKDPKLKPSTEVNMGQNGEVSAKMNKDGTIEVKNNEDVGSVLKRLAENSKKENT